MEQRSRRLIGEAVRYLIAIAAAILAGEVAQVAAAVSIDLLAGHEVTGGQWALNLPNFIVMIIVGAAIGSVAGAIARRHGILIAAIAALLPFETLLDLVFSHDLSSLYASKAALWAWVALIPAMACGHLTAKASQEK